MQNKNINLRNKTLVIRCNYCGNINKIKANDEIVCKYCHKDINVDISERFDVNIQSEEYYLYQLKAAIINHDDEKIEKYKEDLKLLECHDDIYMHLINRRALKNFEKEENVDFIVEYMILQNKNFTKEEKITRIKKTNNKEKYLKMLGNEEESQELYDNVYEENTDNSSFDVVKDNSFKFFVLFLSISTILSILLRFLSQFIFPEEVLFPSMIIVSVVPATLFTISMMKIIKIKNQFLRFLIIIGIIVGSFLIISFLLTLHLSEGSMKNRFDTYLYHLINGFKEINEAMNANFNGE